jgi:hypothetical protein
MPVIGLLHPGSPEANAKYIAGFRKGLAETGYVEGRNLAIEYRWGHGDSGRLPELAAELVGRPVAVIVAPGGVAAALAARPRLRAFRSCPCSASIRSRPGSPSASTGPAATSPASRR